MHIVLQISGNMNKDRAIFNQNERLAMSVNGLESGGMHFNVNEKQAENLVKNEAISKFNTQVDEYVNRFEEHAKALEKAVSEFSMSSAAEIKPVGNYIIVKPFAENPFQRIKKSGGLIIDLGGQRPQYRNNDNGEIEEEENITKSGVIVEVGPECKWAQIGDCIFYPRTSVMPIPFYKQGLELVNETRLIAIINDNLTERFDGR